MENNSLVCRNVDTVTCTVPPSYHVYGEHPVSHGGEPHHHSNKKKGRAALLWGISGGTVLSAVGFIALALFEQYNEGLTELRNDLKHFNETCGDVVKKSEFQTDMTRVWHGFKELRAANVTAAARDVHVANLEQELRAAEEDRKELMREVQQLRERLANVEGRQAATPVVVPYVPPKSEAETP